MRALVTGGAGFLGSHLVEALVAQGDEVTILDDFSGGVIENLFGDYVIKGSITSPELVASAVKGKDIVYHLAALINVDESISFPELFHDVNATGTMNVLKAAKANRVPLVHMSSSEVYGTALYTPMDENHPMRPGSPYAATKLASEMYVSSFVRSYGIKAVIVRGFNMYGPRQKGNATFGGVIAKNIIRIILGLPPIIRGGTQKRDYTYVEDYAKALVTIGKEDLWGEVFNLGSGYSTSVNDITSLLLKLCDREDIKPIMEPQRAGDVLDLVSDFKRAKQHIGWEPQTSFKDGLVKTIKWYRDNQERSKRYLFPSFEEELSWIPYSTSSENGYQIVRRSELESAQAVQRQG